MVSLIETEALLAQTVGHELARLARAGKYAGSFSYQCSFFGYEARAGLPSDFDAAYCYALGANAAALLAHGQTGVISSVTNLGAPPAEWQCGGVPLTAMMNLERRHGKDKPVIRKALVELDQLPFRAFASQRARWALHDCYRPPGPLQLGVGGEGDLCFTLALELAERAAHGLPKPPSARQQAPGGGDVAAAYGALLEGVVGTEGPHCVSPAELHKLELYRLAHGVTDEVHVAALAKHVGVTREAWAALCARCAREAAAAGGLAHA